MATNVIKIIDSQDKVVSQTQVASGKSITVSAKEGQSYEFVSGATKRAPDEIKTTREGNNLKVEIKDGDATSTVVVEDYYTNGEGDLIGLAEDGHFYNFVPEEMGNDYMVTDLADGVSSFQALGSEGDSMSPWWLGLPLLALGAAGGGGGSGAANTLDTTAPDAPSVTMVTDDYDMQAALNSTMWGAYDDTGSWSFDSATEEWSVSSGTVSLIDNTIVTNANGEELIFSGTGGEAGAKISLYDGVVVDPDQPNGTLLGEATVASDGSWSVTIDDGKELADGEYSLVLTQTDIAGNVKEDGTIINVIIDKTIPIDPGNFQIKDSTHSRGYYDAVPGDDDTSTPTGDNYYFKNEFTLSDTLGTSMQGTESVYNEGDSICIELYNSTTDVTYRIIDSTLGIEASAIVDSDGKWSVDVYSETVYMQNTLTGEWEKADLADGEYIPKIAVVEPSGNVSGLIDGGGRFAIDTTAPEANSIESFARDNNDNIMLKGQINNYQKVGLATSDSESGNDIYDRDYDVLTGTEASKLYIYRSDDGGSYAPVGEVNVGQSVNSDWSWIDTDIADDGVYTYKVETLDVAGNSSVGEAFYAVVDADRDGNYDGATAGVAGTDGNEVFQTDVLNLGFQLDGGAGVDTLVLNPTSSTATTLTLDSNTVNFEIYNLGTTATLKIDDLASVQNAGSEYTDHALTIQGKTGSEVDLELDAAAWVDTGDNQVIDGVTYNVYHYDGADTSSNLWIQDGVSVI